MKLLASTVLLALIALTKATPAPSRLYINPAVKYDSNFPMEGPYFEGDMRLTEEQVEQLLSNKLVPTKQLNQLWPSGKLYYKVDKAFSAAQRANISRGVDLINSKLRGCVSIEERQVTSNLKNYVTVLKGDGCSSDIGMQKGPQQLFLVDGCVTVPGKIAHEFIHALGFAHEQKRPDREKFVKFHRENLKDDEDEYQFRTYAWGDVETYDLPYDYASIMHYGPTFFGKYVNGVRQVTLEVLNPTPNKRIGREEKLSDQDIQMIRYRYDC